MAGVHRLSRGRSGALPLLLGVLLAAVLAACSSKPGPPPPPSPNPVVAAFVAAWGGRDWVHMERLVDQPPADFAALNQAALTTLNVTSATYTLGAVTVHGADASAKVTESLKLPVFGPWVVHTNLALALKRGKWLVEWSPGTINPAFGTDGSYGFRYVWPVRAPVLAADGTPISPSVPSSVVIGLYWKYVVNPTALTKALLAAGATSSEIQSSTTAARASPSTFEPVFTVGWGQYEQLRPALYPVPGVFFQAQGGGASSTPPSLVDVVGLLGTISKAQLKKYGPPYDPQSIVGVGGIEEEYERQLAGSPGGVVSLVGPTGAVGTALATFPSRPGSAVRTTIDLADQQDAARALSSAPGEAALVAIDATTGKVLAAADTSQGSDLALGGEQPPGSTMKMITSTALIEKGLTPSSPVKCPPVINVDGENIHNAEASEGSVPDLFTAFTVSCNTAFIGLTMANLGFSDLHDAAALYGVGGKWDPGLAVFTGSVPVNDGQTDEAASAIGQARVLMSPLDLAMVAADIDSGTVRLPWVTVGAPSASAPTSPLPANLDADLKEMMLSVVEHGTAAGTGLPPGTYAKTGTAEYGTGSQLSIDAWLAGFNGNTAFTMVVVNSPGFGGPTDGPIVAKFLDSLGTTG
jgi:cell division protein FtsI/penicillin-binding protein 2